MKPIVMAALAAAVLAGAPFGSPALAKSAPQSAAQTNMTTCAASRNAKSAAEKKTTTHQAFMSACLKSGSGPKAAMTAPAATPKTAPARKTAAARPAAPVKGATGTSARCKDGKVIAIKTHSGACSHHGGVAAWL